MFWTCFSLSVTFDTNMKLADVVQIGLLSVPRESPHRVSDSSGVLANNLREKGENTNSVFKFFRPTPWKFHWRILQAPPLPPAPVPKQEYQRLPTASSRRCQMESQDPRGGPRRAQRLRIGSLEGVRGSQNAVKGNPRRR